MNPGAHVCPAESRFSSVAIWFLAVVITGSLPALATADPILATPHLEAEVFGQFGDLPTFAHAFTDVFDGTVSAAQTSGTAFFGTLPFRTSAQYSGQARVTFGSFQAKDSLKVIGQTISPVPSLASSARAVDLLTVDGGTGSGIIDFEFEITGRARNSQISPPFGGPIGSSFVGFGLERWHESGTGAFMGRLLTNGSFSETFHAPIEFEFGAPFGIDMFLSTESKAGCIVLVQLECSPGWIASSLTDFFNTAVMTRISVTDAAGNPVDDFTIASASGTRYTADGVVAEPSSLTLVALGFIAAARKLRATNWHNRSN